MFATTRLAGASLVLLALAGCQPTPTSPPPAPATTAPDTPQDVEKSKAAEPAKPAADAGKLSEEELAEVKKLPADEQPIALAQLNCPVGGGHLGGMGMPIKQKIGDRTFYICCEGCEKEVKEHPDAVLAKLPAPASK